MAEPCHTRGAPAPSRFGPLADLYRQAFAQSGHPPDEARVSVGTPGFIGPDDAAAHDLWWTNWHEAMVAVSPRGFRPPVRAQYDQDSHAGGALFIGDPEGIAERIITLHESLGHMRHFIQMDIGGLPQRDFLKSIELLGTAVKPLIDRKLGPEPQDLRGAVRR